MLYILNKVCVYYYSKNVELAVDFTQNRLDFRRGTVVAIVVDPHIQRIVLATEETTVTQQVSHRPIKCQSLFSLWSRRGTKVNGSHHGDKSLLRSTGIQIATKSYATLQVYGTDQCQNGSTNLLTPYREQSRSTRMLSPTHDRRSQQQSGKITLQPVLINKSKFLKAAHRTKIRKVDVPRSMVVEALS